MQVTDDQWREFRIALDEANVWTWKKNYTDPNSTDLVDPIIFPRHNRSSRSDPFRSWEARVIRVPVKSIISKAVVCYSGCHPNIALRGQTPTTVSLALIDEEIEESLAALGRIYARIDHNEYFPEHWELRIEVANETALTEALRRVLLILNRHSICEGLEIDVGLDTYSYESLARRLKHGHFAE